MNAGMKALLIENLKKLKLSTMIRNLQGLIRQAKQDKLSYEEFLLNLSEAEVQARQENGRKRRLREAKFPILKPMETFNFDAAPELDVRLMKELSNCDYVKKSRNIIFMGKSGTGKTHLATALGMEACKQGVRTRFVTGCGLANELIEARDEKLLGRAVKRYAGYGMLIIDELGYLPIDKIGADLLFQIISRRYEQGSIVITANRVFKVWPKIFNNDSTLTSALLDRLLHHTEAVVIEGESYRMKEVKTD